MAGFEDLERFLRVMGWIQMHKIRGHRLPHHMRNTNEPSGLHKRKVVLNRGHVER